MLSSERSLLWKASMIRYFALFFFLIGCLIRDSNLNFYSKKNSRRILLVVRGSSWVWGQNDLSWIFSCCSWCCAAFRRDQQVGKGTRQQRDPEFSVNAPITGCCSSCGNRAGCVSTDDVENLVLNIFQSLPVFLPLKDSLHLLLSRIFLLNKYQYLKCITTWSNSSTPQVSGIILIIALITWKRLVKSFFWQTEMQIIVKKVGI